MIHAVALAFLTQVHAGATSHAPSRGGPVPAIDEIPYDNAAGRHLLFNLPVRQGMVFSRDGSVLYAIDQPGARLAFLDPTTLARTQQVPIGLGAVSVGVRPGTSEIWVVDAVDSCVSVVDPALGAVVRTLRVGGQPSGLAFTADGDRAYVTCSGVDRVDVIDAHVFAVVKSIAIPARDPRGIAHVAGRTFVASFLSGNGTAPKGRLADPSSVIAVGVPAPPQAAALPDRDLFVIPEAALPEQDALDPSATLTGLGTTLFDVVARPGTNDLWIPNTDALNAAHKGEVNFVAGQVVRNRITIVDRDGATAPRVIDLDALAPSGLGCGQPASVCFDPSQPIAYVAAYGNDLIAVLSIAPNGAVAWHGTIEIPASQSYPRGTGPRQCLVDAGRTALYVYDLNDAAVTRIALASLPPTPGYDVTAPSAVRVGLDATSGFERLGRHLFTNARLSASKTSSCASCHVDGHTDGLAWDLSHYLDPEGTPDSQLRFGTDVKGPMVTQSVRSMGDLGPFHWRGEIPTTGGFSGTFVNLLENTVNGTVQPIGPDFQYLRHFMDLLVSPPNPREPLDRRPTPGQLAGARLFLTRPLQGSTTCASCHALPIGTGGEVVVESAGGMTRSAVVPSLRDVADKLAPPMVLGGPYGVRTELGAGLTHGGVRSSLEDAMTSSAPPGAGGHSFALTQEEARSIAEFLSGFDTGVAPAAGLMVTANPGNWAYVASHELSLLEDSAARGDCELVFHRVPRIVHGHLAELSGLYDPALGAFRVGSRTSPPIDAASLLAEAAGGLPVVFLGVPIGMGESQGLDRDMDGLFDLDEITAGTDPENPDTDGDGFGDGEEVLDGMNPLVPDATSVDTTPPQLAGPLRLLNATTDTLRFEFETSEFCRAYLSTNGGPVVTRIPFNQIGDHHHWATLNGLLPDTDYRIGIMLLDTAGNSSFDSSTVFHTRPRATPDPSHVGAIDLSIVTSGGVEHLQARISIGVGSAAAGAGYGVSVAAYQMPSDGSLHMISSGTSAATASDGVAQFLLDPLPRGPSPGKLYVVVQDVTAPAGGAGYARALDTPNLATLAF